MAIPVLGCWKGNGLYATVLVRWVDRLTDLVVDVELMWKAVMPVGSCALVMTVVVAQKE